jgi:hypothetical protein
MTTTAKARRKKPPKDRLTAPAEGGRQGRPTKLVPEIAARILVFLRAGNYIHIAAAAAGVHRDTLNGWLHRGARAPHGIFKDFADGVQQAVAEGEVRHLNIIREAAAEGKQWQAAAWILERTHPDRYGRRERVDLDAKVQATVSVQDARKEIESKLLRLAATARAEAPPG